MYTCASRLRQTSPNEIAGIVGSLVDTEAMVAFKDLLNRFDCDHLYTEGELPPGTSTDLRTGYLLNDRLTAVEDCDALLLVGTNPRYEVPGNTSKFVL